MPQTSIVCSLIDVNMWIMCSMRPFRNNSWKYANCLQNGKRLGRSWCYTHTQTVEICMCVCVCRALNEWVFMWLPGRMRNMIIIRPFLSACRMLSRIYCVSRHSCSDRGGQRGTERERQMHSQTETHTVLCLFLFVCIIDKIFAGIFLYFLWISSTSPRLRSGKCVKSLCWMP